MIKSGYPINCILVVVHVEVEVRVELTDLIFSVGVAR